MKIFISGGAGFLGSHLVDRLMQDEVNQVMVYDNLIRGRIQHMFHQYPNSNFTYVEGDIRDFPRLVKAARGADLIYHMADFQPPALHEVDLDYLFTTVVNGTYNVLQAARENEIRKLVFGSSLDVYAAPFNGPVVEGHPLGSSEPYGAGKIAGEMWCRVFRQRFGLDLVILRIGKAYGARQKDDRISRWINQARQGKEILLERDGVCDYLPVRVVVQGLLAAGGVSTELPINLASGQATRLADLAARIVQLSGMPVKVTVRQDGLEEGAVGDVQRMQALLGVKPPPDPLEGLPDLVAPRPTLLQDSL